MTTVGLGLPLSIYIGTVTQTYTQIHTAHRGQNSNQKPFLFFFCLRLVHADNLKDRPDDLALKRLRAQHKSQITEWNIIIVRIIIIIIIMMKEIGVVAISYGPVHINTQFLKANKIAKREKQRRKNSSTHRDGFGIDDFHFLRYYI